MKIIFSLIVLCWSMAAMAQDRIGLDYDSFPCGEEKWHGRLTLTNENGEGWMSLPFICGNLSGVCLTYDKDGHLRSEQAYQDGQLDGFSIFYSPLGRVEVFQEYQDGLLLCEKREILDEGTSSVFINDLTQVEWRWHMLSPPSWASWLLVAVSSRVQNTMEKNDDKLMSAPVVSNLNEGGEWEVSYVPGTTNIHHIVPLSNGVKHGRMTMYRTNGLVRMSIPYIHGEISGAWLTYSQDGCLKSEQAYRNGKKDGVDIIYSTQGEIEWVEEYKDGHFKQERKGTDPFSKFDKQAGNDWKVKVFSFCGVHIAIAINWN